MLGITGTDGTSIEVHDASGGQKRLTVTAGRGGGAEILLDAGSAHQVGMALGVHPEGLGHSANTLDKVRAGIMAARPYLAEGAVNDLINGIMNQGVVFRESA